jgi:hypothetical protein
VYTSDWTKAGPGLFLAGRDGGWVVADAYKGYDYIFNRENNPPIEVGVGRMREDRSSRLPSWVSGASPCFSCAEALQVERESKDAGETIDERFARRTRDSKPIIDAMRAWFPLHHQTDPPESAFAKAIGYVMRQWTALTRFLERHATTRS